MHTLVQMTDAFGNTLCIQYRHGLYHVGGLSSHRRFVALADAAYPTQIAAETRLRIELAHREASARLQQTQGRP